jgi:hypothetical protein
MGTILRDTKRCTLIGFLLRGETINSCQYIHMLQKLHVTLQPGLHEETHYLSTCMTSLHTWCQGQFRSRTVKLTPHPPHHPFRLHVIRTLNDHARRWHYKNIMVIQKVVSTSCRRLHCTANVAAYSGSFTTGRNVWNKWGVCGKAANHLLLLRRVLVFCTRIFKSKCNLYFQYGTHIGSTSISLFHQNSLTLWLLFMWPFHDLIITFKCPKWLKMLGKVWVRQGSSLAFHYARVSGSLLVHIKLQQTFETSIIFVLECGFIGAI